MFVFVKLHGLKCARWNQEVLVLHFSQQNAAPQDILLPAQNTLQLPRDPFNPLKAELCYNGVREALNENFLFFFFWRTFIGFFDLQLMEDIKDEKEEVLDEVVMEHIK